jgi:GNAT superfamily N-acetyltransferase
VIRRREPEDLDALVAALAKVHADDNYPTRWPEDPVQWLTTRDPYGAWVAEWNGQPVGQVVLRPAVAQAPVLMWSAVTGHDPAYCCVIGRLFVAGSARGHGLGQGLLEAAVTDAGERRLTPVLDVVDQNAAAIRLYERLGWIHLGTYRERFTPEGPEETLHCFAAA